MQVRAILPPVANDIWRHVGRPSTVRGGPRTVKHSKRRFGERSFDFCLYLDQPTIDFLDQYLELSRAELLQTELTVEQMAQVDLRRSILWDFEDYQYEF
jgi:hypothetical protein